MLGLASQSLPIHQHASHSFTVSSTYACRGFSSTSEGANGAAESEEGKEQLEGEPVSPDEAAAGAPATDNAKIEKLEKDLKDMKDKALRALAEEENVRRIAKRDVDNAKVQHYHHAQSQFVSHLFFSSHFIFPFLLFSPTLRHTQMKSLPSLYLKWLII